MSRAPGRDLNRDRVANFVAAVRDVDPGAVQISVEWFPAGLEAGGVADLQARYADHRGRAWLFRFAVKILAGHGLREGAIYRQLVRREAGRYAP